MRCSVGTLEGYVANVSNIYLSCEIISSFCLADEIPERNGDLRQSVEPVPRLPDWRPDGGPRRPRTGHNLDNDIQTRHIFLSHPFMSGTNSSKIKPVLNRGLYNVKAVVPKVVGG